MIFHPLEVVDRGSETQLQVGGHLNSLCNFIFFEFSTLMINVKTKDINLICGDTGDACYLYY